MPLTSHSSTLGILKKHGSAQQGTVHLPSYLDSDCHGLYSRNRKMLLKLYLRLCVCTMFLCRKFNASIVFRVLVTILALLLITSDLEHFLLNNLGNYLTEGFLEIVISIKYLNPLPPAGGRTLLFIITTTEGPVLSLPPPLLDSVSYIASAMEPTESSH